MMSLAVAVGHLGHGIPFGRVRRAPAEPGRVEDSVHESVAPAARADAFRPDVEGLRGIAILFVVLFHSGLVAVPGGFVGVDVFFVISGFLITGLLLRERERTGRIALGAFYVRRLRRLMPAALVAVAVILPVAAAVVAPLDRPTVSLDGAAAAISVANVRFAAADGGYFTVLASPSPFMHFWSLSVEEQFYLVWPALLLLGARGRRPRLGAAIVLGTVFVLSFGACLVVTEMAPTWAFYMLPTRAWQLATGGLLAIGAVWLARLPGLPMATLGWAGLAVVLGAPLVLDPSMAYPGAIALLPTLGAACLIASGGRRWSPAGLLAVGPLRFLGRISYSLYLWHWPILVLPAIAAGAPIEPVQRAGLVAASIVVATLSWACIEEPFRRGMPRLAIGRTRTFALAGVALAFVVATAGGLWYGQERDLDLASASQTDTATGGTDGGGDGGDDIDWTTGDGATALPDLVDNQTGDPDPSAGVAVTTPGPTPTSQTPSASATATPQPTPTAKVSYVLPGDVRPSLTRARGDTERPWRDGCLVSEAGTTPPRCTYGDPNGHFVVALIGDSHASALFPAVDAIARHRGWRLDTYLKVDCPYIDMRVRSITFKREYSECATWRAAVAARIAASPPDLVIVTNSRWIHAVLDEDGTLARQEAALARMITRLPGLVVVVADIPAADREIPGCLSAHTMDIRPCAVPQSTAFSGAMRTRERVVARETGAGFVDLTAAVCPADPCPAVVRGMIVLRDSHHLTATFARSLAPPLDKLLTAFLHPAAQPRSLPTPTPTPTPIPSGLPTPIVSRPLL
jgi:peptidoglycan/LPS O-acetylase OafA/YrhL